MYCIQRKFTAESSNIRKIEQEQFNTQAVHYTNFFPKFSEISAPVRPVLLVKGSLVEKHPSYGDLKMQRDQKSNSSVSNSSAK